MMNRCFIFLLCGFFLLSSCSKESSDSGSQSSASVSIYALVPDAPQFNFFLNGTNVAASVPFGSFTLYNHVNSGTVMLKAQTLAESTAVDTPFTTTENRYYSLFITGSLSGIKPVLIQDFQDSITSVDSGFIKMRFFVFSPGVSNIDFHIVKDSTVKDTLKNRSFTDNIATDSINKFVQYPVGTYSFYAIKTNSIKDTLAKFTGKAFSNASNYTLLLEGNYDKAAGDTTLLLGTRKH